MTTLDTSLNTIGISQAKGVDLVVQREQLGSTLPSGNGVASVKPAAKELTPEQQREVAELQQIDRAVRAHEAAHIAAGHGVITSGPNYTFTYGPDGRQYVNGGEVGIDTSPERKPEANIDKGIRIQAAALAPKDPSPQDYRAASIGGQIEAKGRSDLARQRLDETYAGRAAGAPRVSLFA